MKFFVNYYQAKRYAKKHGLKEAEYGDWYPNADMRNMVSYVTYNTSGDRDDEAEVECYYKWERRDDRWRPEQRASRKELTGWVLNNIGEVVR